MNDNAKKWVAALRSGEYKQTRYKLHAREGGFCCLGVACEVFRQETGAGEWDAEGIDTLSFRTSPWEQPEMMALPNSVKDWLGLNGDEGEFVAVEMEGITGRVGTLSRMNDRGKTFEQIAGWIETEPEGLFRKEEDDE